jgi:predicted RNA-binding Zn-ribbon protein involved in translation (DUF1610 family)
MEIKRATEIFIERTRRFIIRFPDTGEAIPCPVCGEQMLTAEMSAALLQIKCRRIYQLVEAGAIHFLETETGAIYACPQSFGGAAENSEDEIKS